MTIKPIRTEADYEEALAQIAQLFNSSEGTEEYDRLDLLTTLVEAYEAKHYPIDAPDPITAIEYEAEKRGLSRKDLARYIGSSGRVSEVMSKRRKLSLAMMRRLHDELGISGDVLLKQY
jgi:HTH-type transcriptional regulator/antitoxin HigA